MFLLDLDLERSILNLSKNKFLDNDQAVDEDERDAHDSAHRPNYVENLSLHAAAFSESSVVLSSQAKLDEKAFLMQNTDGVQNKQCSFQETV